MQPIHRLYGRLSPFFRRQRFRWFRRQLPMTADESLLDVGGYPWFWQESALPNPITLLNLEFASDLPARFLRYKYITGDGCHLPFGDKAFAVLFSNSVIEHVGTWERQQQFASEARRVGRRLWVQTPAREFFVEPHLVAPLIHWLPASWKRRLIRRGTIWGWLARPTPAQVDGFLSEVRLLRRSEMRLLFPDCEILTERLLGLPKSYIAIRRS